MLSHIGGVTAYAPQWPTNLYVGIYWYAMGMWVYDCSGILCKWLHCSAVTVILKKSSCKEMSADTLHYVVYGGYISTRWKLKLVSRILMYCYFLFSTSVSGRGNLHDFWLASVDQPEHTKGRKSWKLTGSMNIFYRTKSPINVLSLREKKKNRRYAYESERETIALVDKCAKKELL